MARIVAAVGRRPPARPRDRKVEILGVAGAGKSTVARMLSQGSGFETATFIHTRRPSHLFQVVRSIPRLLPIIVGGITRRPRISWPELKLLVYVTRWRRFLRRHGHSGAVSVFDQGPLYALVRLKAEGKPFTRSRAFETWREGMLEGWSSELDMVIWLDAPDQVLWGRINDRPQGHKKKGQEPEVGHRFIADYRRSFEDVLQSMDELGGPEVLRFDTGAATPEQITETIRPLLLTARSAGGGRSVPVTGREAEGTRVVENAPDRRMRVLHVIIMLGETNGQYNEHCLPLMHERDISIVTYFVPKLTPPPEITLFAGDGTLRGFFRVLRIALNAQEYDVVHAHAPQTGSLLVLAALAWRRFGRLHPSLVYTVQDSFQDYSPRNRAMMAISLAAFTRIVFCSRSAYESLPRRLKQLVRGRWRVVQNGADLDRIDRAIATRPAERDEGGFTVVSVGRLERVKDPLVALESFSRSVGEDAGSRAVFVGAGELSPIVAARARELRLEDRVVLTGLVPRDEVFVMCADADVFVSTSHGEGLPVAVLEAMAAGCPVILSDIPPHREVADGADFIPFVAPGDVEGFAVELKRFHEMSPEERHEIGRRCRTHMADRFTLPIMRAGTEAVYREVAPGVGDGARTR